jgi:hypothetical protein
LRFRSRLYVSHVFIIVPNYVQKVIENIRMHSANLHPKVHFNTLRTNVFIYLKNHS